MLLGSWNDFKLDSALGNGRISLSSHSVGPLSFFYGPLSIQDDSGRLFIFIPSSPFCCSALMLCSCRKLCKSIQTHTTGEHQQHFFFGWVKGAKQDDKFEILRITTLRRESNGQVKYLTFSLFLLVVVLPFISRHKFPSLWLLFFCLAYDSKDCSLQVVNDSESLDVSVRSKWSKEREKCTYFFFVASSYQLEELKLYRISHISFYSLSVCFFSYRVWVNK